MSLGHLPNKPRITREQCEELLGNHCWRDGGRRGYTEYRRCHHCGVMAEVRTTTELIIKESS